MPRVSWIFTQELRTVEVGEGQVAARSACRTCTGEDLVSAGVGRPAHLVEMGMAEIVLVAKAMTHKLSN